MTSILSSSLDQVYSSKIVAFDLNNATTIIKIADMRLKMTNDEAMTPEK
ncbi:14521_t:CDS:2 [Gigaspora margarita]|uniref:14521_t:CDS:1 n=1 Tax=Gigaspora margarita TaxID=4874 RepID=A0ABN7UUX8_GIGMA|nr:14521_t:CDS:2 [Gigaspora margarita]